MILFLNSPIEQFNFIPFFICSGFSNLSLFYVIIVLVVLGISINSNKIKLSEKFFIYNFKDLTVYLFDINIKKNLKIINTPISFSFIPTYSQYIFESLIFEFNNAFKNLLNLNKIFIFLYSVLTAILFILFSNLIGLIPYTFTITAQIFITLNLSLLLFISFNMIGFLNHKVNLIQLVIPSGVHLALHFLLIPIEIISYIFRPISLSIRLFANIMAGHTLLKVICGFIYKFLKLDLMIIFSILPFGIITILFGLECFVALIQSYVFFILLSLFLKDILSLSH